MIEFKNNHRHVGDLGDFTEEQIQAEPMIYGGSIMWTRIHGGIMTARALTLVELAGMDLDWHARRGYHPVIDTKVVLLMPGMYSCIPGWHCDGVIRKKRGSQPDLSTLDEEVDHFLVSYDSENGETAPEFLDHLIGVPPNAIDPDQVWKSVNSHISKSELSRSQYGNGEMVKFQRSSLHRGVPAMVRQWKYFFRLSFYHMPAMNEIRKQVQVYTDVNGGW